MSTTARAGQLAFEAAERRVLESLRGPESASSSTRRVTALSAAALLYACTFAARLAINDPDALIANFYVLPVAVLAIEFGPRAGVLGAAFGVGLVFAWSAVQSVHVDALVTGRQLVGDEPVELPAGVDGRAVREVAAMIEA